MSSSTISSKSQVSSCTGHSGSSADGSGGSHGCAAPVLAEAEQDEIEAAFGSDPIPGHVITIGILEARRCVLLAHGARKAQALAATVEGPVTSMVPGSALQLHASVAVLCDEAAAARRALADYYRDVYARKPAWQR